MAEVEGLNSNSLYFASLQAANAAAVRQQKTEKAKEADKLNKARKSTFTDALKKADDEQAFSLKGLPPEIQGMSLDEAGIFLRDAVDAAGNELASVINAENLNNFKKAVAQFITFVVENNFEENRKEDPRVLIARKRGQPEPTLPPTAVFSTYNTQRRKINPKITIQVINQKLDEITRDVLKRQSDNLKILSNINEVKGLVVDILNG